MKTSFSAGAFTAAVLLHAAMAAAVLAGMSVRLDKAEFPEVVVRLLAPEPPPSVAPTPLPVEAAPSFKPDTAPEAVPEAASDTATEPAPPAPVPTRPERKRIAKPKPALPALPVETPSPSRVAASDTATATPAPAPPAAAAPEPPAATVTAAAPSTPAVTAPASRTGVSIPAAYAASNRKPEYPAMSRRYEEQGTVVLLVLVNTDGTAGEVKLKSSSGYPLLDKSAISAVRNWRFNPATNDGKPLAEWYQVPIPFTLRD